jgi:hypothetical protein
MTLKFLKSWWERSRQVGCWKDRHKPYGKGSGEGCDQEGCEERIEVA